MISGYKVARGARTPAPIGPVRQPGGCSARASGAPPDALNGRRDDRRRAPPNARRRRHIMVDKSASAICDQMLVDSDEGVERRASDAAPPRTR